MKTIIRSSMKKMLYVIFFCMLVLFSVVEAGAVRVKGTGMDKESAMRDAMRVAVERVEMIKKVSSIFYNCSTPELMVI